MGSARLRRVAPAGLNRRMHPPWQVLADTLLQREALTCRLGDGIAPHDFAGLYVGSADVDRILAALPGLTGASAQRVEALRRDLAPGVAAAREAFTGFLAGESTFARIVRSGRL